MEIILIDWLIDWFIDIQQEDSFLFKLHRNLEEERIAHLTLKDSNTNRLKKNLNEKLF